jgi:D-amino-acid dehydrogenase
MTPDGKPFIDFAPAARNVLVAAGHNMIGMSTGPGTGVLAAELLTGESPHLDPRPFRIART